MYNRNKLASKVFDTVVKIQQKRYPKVVDKLAEMLYNRDKLASNVGSKCCKNTTKKFTKSC
jgi:hypothetical protein